MKDALDSVYNNVVSIDSEVQSMSMHLQATRAQTYQLIDHTTQLQAQRYQYIVCICIDPQFCTLIASLCIRIENMDQTIRTQFYFSKQLSMEQEVASAFLERYQLSSAELSVLHGSTRDSPITPAFFKALQHAQSIHSDCRMLMQSGFQTIALDVMEQMSLHQVMIVLNFCSVC